MKAAALLALVALVALVVLGARPPAYADNAPSPTPAAAEPNLVFGGGGPDAKRAIFLFAQGSDTALNTKIVLALAHRLQRAHVFVQHSFVVPEGTWTTAQFLRQCASDADGTRGALIVLPATTYTATENYVFLARSHTDVVFEVMIATCSAQLQASAATPGTARVVWVSDTAYGKGQRTSVEFFPLTVLASLYLAFAPTKIYSRAATTTYPVASPIPAGGNLSSVTTAATASTNNNGSGFIPSLIAAFGTGTNSSTFGQLPSNDSQAWFAADRASRGVVGQLGAVCNPPAPAGPAVQPVSDDRPAFCTW